MGDFSAARSLGGGTGIKQKDALFGINILLSFVRPVHPFTMKATVLLAALMLTQSFAARSDAKDPRLFEMRTYHAAAGKLDDLHARFRNHTTKLFEKHRMTNIGYWVPVENSDNVLIYVLAFANREARDASFKAFGADPEWQKAAKESEANGKLVTKVDQLFLTATDFSPEVKPSTGAPDRVFELRTYTATPGNLATLHARFRDYTMALFAKHGMTNLFYWQLAPGQPGVDNTLVYLLAHPSVEAAKVSFDAFRADPDWIAAKKASEDKGGGSLTLPDGVKSVFMKATDYSPLR